MDDTVTDDDAALRGRSIRTLAWLGDAIFEDEVRTRVALRGDYPIDRLDAIKAAVVRSETQAQLFAEIEPELDEAELALARRARNTAPPAGARGRRTTKDYRTATALEALVAHWRLLGDEGRARLEALLAPRLEAVIDAALHRHARRPKRG
jgi:ribonuclease III family protein